MTITISQLFAPTVLTTSAATLYTLPTLAGTALPNLRVRFANTSGGAVTITAYAIQSGGSASAGTCCANAESIAANNHLDLDIPTLTAGGFFQALCSANTSCTVSQLQGTLYNP